MKPASEHEIVAKLLTESVSVDAHVRDEAYARIVELESRPNFLATLIDVAYIGDPGISKLAFICAKNALARTRGIAAARAARSNVVDFSDEALDNLKLKLLSVFELHLKEDGRVLGKDFALLVRKVSRWNYPQGWIAMHELLVRGVEAGLTESVASTKTLNSVLLLYHIFKEKCSMRLVRDRNVTMQLAEAWYPFVSKLWVHQWLHRWASGNIDALQLGSRLSSLDMELSRYLDTLLIAMYTHGLRNVYQSPELLELLKMIFMKLVIHLSLFKAASVCNEVLEKNTRRLLRGAAEIFEKEAMVLAFLDPALILNPVFDYLACGSSGHVIQHCMYLLSNAFKSPVINNERYVQQFSAIHRHGNGHRDTNKIGDDGFVLYSTFDEMKSHCEMAASCSRGVSLVSSLKNSSSPTKGSYISLGGVAEQMSRQATYLFWKCISERGGFLQLIEFLRHRYMTLSVDTIAEWSEEHIPMEDPPHPPAHTVISAMKLTGADILQWIADGLMAGDTNLDFPRLDSYMQIYTIAYPVTAAFHSCKHYHSFLDAMKVALTVVGPEMAKLLIFRCSRIVNAWVERIQLFEEQTKREIMVYLVYCLCCPADTPATLNLRVQHVVPFHRLYTKTVDEPFWDVLRQGTDVQQIVTSLVNVANVDVPVVQHTALELVCKMCLEFDSEENNFGHQLSDLLNVFSTRCNDLQTTSSLLQTSLGFLNALDWQRCYAEESYVNAHLRRFLFYLLFRTLAITDLPGSPDETTLICQRMVSPCRYPELDEDILTLWVCLLRVLPHNLKSVDRQLLNDVFSLFPLFLAYLINNDIGDNTGQVNVHRVPVLQIDIVTEYLAVILDFSKTYLSNTGSSLCERVDGVWFQKSIDTTFFLEFNLSLVHTICLRSLKRSEDDALRQSGLRLLNILMFGFSAACLVRQDVLVTMHDVLLCFCSKLNEAAVTPQEAPPEIRRYRASGLCRGTGTDSEVRWQVSKVQNSIVESISSVIPILTRWGFDAPASFSEALQRVLERGRFAYPEGMLLSLLHASIQFNNNAYLRLGALICCCLMAGSMVSKYPGLRLFVRYQGSPTHGNSERHNYDGFNENPHENMTGVFLPCYLLRLVNSIVTLFVTSKRDVCFSITKATLLKNREDYSKPSSKRFHLFANVSSTYQSTGFPMSDTPPQELFYGELL
ncbi:Importin-11 [Babesia sp. Xinjiang]|uniref:Importin-11 n=1 Tax=Babesia sp. Xinjiang TaxID=462227 RepID=UPI000A242EA5|nr:Importin-11 [Babesia sp. Xinjiang]ORM41993.1 Importin-11 [Babesia sp. Xinjiang]